MFHITRDIKIADVQNGAKDFHYCRRHRLSFNPAGFCKVCGDLRPPLITINPDTNRQIVPGVNYPWMPINVPYNPQGDGIYRGTTSPNTITWDPGRPTFTVSSGTYVPPNTTYSVSVVGGGGGGGSGSISTLPVGALVYSSDDGSIYTSDGTSYMKIGDVSVVK